MSANPERGEIEVTTESGKTYVLRPSLQACCVVQQKLKKKYGQIEVDALTGDSEAMRAMFWTYLQAHHKDEAATVEDAARLVDEIGLFEVGRAIGELMELNKPPEKKNDAPEGMENPTKAANSTGAA